jgi:hypothetical protein
MDTEVEGPDHPLWVSLLWDAYEAGGTGLQPFSTRISSYGEWPDEEAIERASIPGVVNDMEEMGLIQTVHKEDEDAVVIKLKQKGFDYIHNYELNEQAKLREIRQDRRQHNVNRGVAYLTIGLVITGGVRAIAASWSDIPLLGSWILTCLTVAVVAMIIFLLFRADMLESYEAPASE